MSLRTKLTWAFVGVAAVALIPAAVMLNAGMYVTMVAPWGPRMHMPMMERGGGMGMGPGMGSGMGSGMGGAHEEPLAGSPHDVLATARNWSIWSSLAAFAIAGAAGYFTAGRIIRPLNSLRDAAHHLDLRDLSRRVPVADGGADSKDEISDLARTFNLMCDRLEMEEKARRSLLADVAHELRHPLAVLQGRLELMQDGKVELDQEALLPLQDEVIRLTRLVGDLRDLSLAEVGGLSLRRTEVDLAAMLDGLLTNMEPVAAAKSISLLAEIPTRLPVIVADGDRIRQVLVNLLANAIQYTPQGGRVVVRAEAESEGVRISVRDTGPGIAEADLPHLFDRFYRADKSRSRGTGGTGLGLAIVRSLIEAHGGRVWAESLPGQGACFTVLLPTGGG